MLFDPERSFDQIINLQEIWETRKAEAHSWNFCINGKQYFLLSCCTINKLYLSIFASFYPRWIERTLQCQWLTNEVADRVAGIVERARKQHTHLRFARSRTERPEWNSRNEFYHWVPVQSTRSWFAESAKETQSTSTSQLHEVLQCVAKYISRIDYSYFFLLTRDRIIRK